MTLNAKQLAAWPPSRLTPWGAEARSSNDAGSVQQYAGEVSDGSRPSGPAPADGPGPASADGGHAVSAAAEARFAGYTYPNTGAAVKAWNALSDPRATVAALDAVSEANPVVRSLAQGRGNAAAQGAADRTCPPYIASVFANLAIYQDMARRLNTDVDFIMALSAHEGAWLGVHSQELHNLFGVTRGGGPNLGYESYQAAAGYWMAHFGPYVQGARTMDDFIAGLRRAHYNTRDSNYDKNLKDTFTAVQRYKRACGIE